MVRIILLLGTSALLLAACDHRQPGPTALPDQPAAQTFEVKGVVMELDPGRHWVRIKHEEIPGYMAAMTMPFDVRDTNELDGVEEGHPVMFRMTVTETDGWIDRIRITGPKTNTPPTTGPFRLTRDVDPLAEGDPFPEYQFTNQLGRTFSTARFKGQALAIEFLFTRCPFPTYCPLLARNFEETQQKLQAMPNAPTNWQLLTISFDPEFDTPEVLRRYAERYHYNPQRWTFATGALIDVTAIAEQFGLTFWREPGSIISHNLRTAVIDASGRVQRILVGNEWSSDELVAEMIQAAGAQP